MPADGENESAKPSAKEGFDRIFLSYARDDDEAFVGRLYADLTQAGFNVWFDRVSMPSRSLTFQQEIRDAIASRGRLILVVGPKAITSDYVMQEWQFAYYAANKCVNPIVRLDGRDSQENKVDGYALIPEVLKLLHAEDFRRDSEYDEHLKNLIRQLSESLPPIGKLVAVPELPPGYRAQPERLKALRDLLLLDLQKPVVVTGAAARVGLQGMGGIGKSVLANALAHHPQVQRAFQDGIYWVTIGQQPRLDELQRQLAVALGGDGQFNNHHDGKEQLRKLLADRAVLLILDDVWERDQADAFNVVSARSRILLTTRDAGLVTALAARENHYRVELPTLAEAQAILGGAADVPPDQLPPAADAIIKECDRLPLALALCGGMVHGGSSWSNVLSALQEHDLEFLSSNHPDEAQHQNAWKAMDISLRILPADEQQRFSELAVFGADTGAPDAAVATLWQHTAGLNPRQTEALLAEFIRRSLVQRPSSTDGKVVARVDLHDLLHHFATGMAIKQFASAKNLHQLLLEAYRAMCPEGWPSGPNDGYFFENLVHHVAATGAWPEGESLVTNFSWLMRKCELGLLDSASRDYGFLDKLAPAGTSHRIDNWADFFREKLHILRRGNDEWPAHKILLQLAIENADDSPLTLAAERWLTEGRCDWLWLRRVQRSPHARKNACLAVLEGHTGGINGLVTLADGRLLSWSSDNTLRFWDIASGKCLAVLEGHTSSVGGALVLADGRLLSWSMDNTLRLWDGSRGMCLAVLEGHTDGVKLGGGAKLCGVSGALVLADGRLLSWAHDRTLRLWDSTTGECLAVLRGHSEGVNGALALADGRLLSWSHNEKTLRVWDSICLSYRAVLEGHTSLVNGALVLADGRLLSWSMDNTLRLWDVRRGACLAVLEGHTYSVGGALALADGHLLSWSGDKTLRLWDSASGACLAVLEGHTEGVLGALALADGRLLSWSWDKTLRLWDCASGACLAVLEGHTDGIHGALALADGRLLSWAFDRTLRLWDSTTGECLGELKGHADICINGAAPLADKRLLSWSEDKTIRVWDSTDAVHIEGIEGHSNIIEDTVPLADGRLLSWSRDKTLRLWDSTDGVCLAVLEGHTDGVAGALVLTDDRLLSWPDFNRSHENTMRLWDSASGACLAVLEGHTFAIRGAFALADGRLLSWSGDETLRLWDSTSGACVAVLKGHADDIGGALALTDGRLLSWSGDKTLRLWDSRSGACLAVLEGHTGRIGGALAGGVGGALELADRRLLSWSLDKTLRVWDSTSTKCLAVLKGHTDHIHDVLALTNGRLLSLSRDKSLRLWDSASGECLAVLKGHTNWVVGALALADGRLLSWSEDKTLRLWDGISGTCLDMAPEDQAASRHPEWLYERSKVWYPHTVVGDFFVETLARLARLRYATIVPYLASWHAESDSIARCLFADGTIVVTQASGQVCILKLYEGNRRITLTETAALIAPQRKKSDEAQQLAAIYGYKALAGEVEPKVNALPQIGQEHGTWENPTFSSPAPTSAQPTSPRTPLTSKTRDSAATALRRGLWEAAATYLEKLLQQGEPVETVAPDLIKSLLNAHEALSPTTVTRVETLLSQLDSAGHTTLAAPLRQRLQAKLCGHRKNQWKFW
jgi:WD40 repeat protein